MTDQSQRGQCATRRCVLFGAGALGVAGMVAACSTAPVPYNVDQDSVQPTGHYTAGPPAQAPSSASAAGAGNGGKQGTLLGLTSEIPVGGGKVFPAAKVVVTQPVKGQYKAFSAVCTHVGCLCNQVANGTIDCPCHGSTFQITDGAVVTGPATSPLPPVPITVTGGKILLS